MRRAPQHVAPKSFDSRNSHFKIEDFLSYQWRVICLDGGFNKWRYPQFSSILDWDFPWKITTQILGYPDSPPRHKSIQISHFAVGSTKITTASDGQKVERSPYAGIYHDLPTGWFTMIYHDFTMIYHDLPWFNLKPFLRNNWLMSDKQLGDGSHFGTDFTEIFDRVFRRVLGLRSPNSDKGHPRQIFLSTDGGQASSS